MVTDRYRAFTVILDQDMRDDDTIPLTQAIRMLKGVARVEPYVVSGSDLLIEITVRTRLAKDIGDELHAVYMKLLG